MRAMILAVALGASAAAAADPLATGEGETYPVYRFRDQPGYGKVVCTATSQPNLYGQFFYGASYDVDKAYWIAMRKCTLAATEPTDCFVSNCTRAGRRDPNEIADLPVEGTTYGR